MWEAIGFVFFGLGAAAAAATSWAFTAAGVRKNRYGIEGENLRAQPNRVALTGMLSAVFLFLIGGVFVAVGQL